MKVVGVVVSLAVLAAGGCSSRLERPAVPGWLAAEHPPVARFETCREMRRAGWGRGVSADGGPAAQKVYELNLHLAYEVGYACRPGGPEWTGASIGRGPAAPPPHLCPRACEQTRYISRPPKPEIHDVSGNP